MTAPDPDSDARRLSYAALAAGDPTGWFEPLYAQARNGEATVPWDRDAPNAMLVDWLSSRAPAGGGRSALVIGCGPGRDSEHLAGLGYRTTAFDISPTAIRMARERHPDSEVSYEVADLLSLPDRWQGRFDLVLESHNVQSLPVPVRHRAIVGVGPLIAPGGTLLVLAAARDESDPDRSAPPWPLSRTEIDAFATGLQTVRVERITDAADPGVSRWRAEFRRPSREEGADDR